MDKSKKLLMLLAAVIVAILAYFGIDANFTVEESEPPAIVETEDAV